MDYLRRKVRALRQITWMRPVDQADLRRNFLGLYLLWFGVSFLYYAYTGEGSSWFLSGFIACCYSGFVYYADRLFKLAWSLWMHFGVFWVLFGLASRSMFFVIADFLVVFGMVIIIVLWLAPFFGYRILNRRRPQHNGHAVVYQHDIDQV